MVTKTDATTETCFSMRRLEAELDEVEVVPAALPLAEVEGDTTVFVPAALKILT